MGNYRICVPRAHLRTKWSDDLDLGPDGFIIQTVEKNIKTAPAPVCVVDETTLVSRGALELTLVWDGIIELLVLIGDPCQFAHHELNENAQCEYLPKDSFNHYLGEDFDYRFYSFRLAPGVGGLFGIPCMRDLPGRVFHRRNFDPALPIICPSELGARVYGLKCFTYGTCTGQDFGDWQVVVDNDAILKCDDRAIYTALTRGSGNLIIIIRFTYTNLIIQTIRRRPLLRAVLFFEPCSILQVFSRELAHAKLIDPPFPPQPFPVDYIYRVRGGLTPMHLVPEECVQLMPYFSGLSWEERPKDPSSLPTRYENSEFGQYQLRSSLNFVLEHFVPTQMSEDREMYDVRLGSTTQLYPDIYDKVHPRLRDFAFLRQCFPYQRDRDDAFRTITLRKRILLGNEFSNRYEYKVNTTQGAIYASAFLRLLGLSLDSVVPLDLDLYSQCIVENEVKKLSKGSQTLVRNDSRANPDPINAHHYYIDLFVKTQVKMKRESLNIPGKAGQSLSLFLDSLLMLLGPWARYLAKKIHALLPPSIYWHNKRTLADLDVFIKERWQDRMSTEMDATAYDHWQGAAGLYMEELLFRVFDCPPDLLFLYIDSKLHSWTFLGCLQIMRLTGEFFTLDGNTYYNIADFCVRHPEASDALLDGTSSLLVVGDDRTYNGVVHDPGSNYRWAASSPPWKYSYSRRPGFVSTIITPYGITKDPTIMLLRIKYNELCGRLREVLPSYYLEFIVSRPMMQEHVHEFSEVQYESYDQLCRVFTRYHDLIPTFLAGTPLASRSLLQAFNLKEFRRSFLSVVKAFKQGRSGDLLTFLHTLPGDWSDDSLSNFFSLLNLYIARKPNNGLLLQDSSSYFCRPEESERSHFQRLLRAY